jgi:hypothetical protein
LGSVDDSQRKTERVITWPTILYGAALTVIVALAAVALVGRERRPTVWAATALAGALGPIAWNAILRSTHSSGFFVDAPVSLLPASWQDFGSGIFALAFSSVIFGCGPLQHMPALRMTYLSAVTALSAFIVDVYLY